MLKFIFYLKEGHIIKASILDSDKEKIKKCFSKNKFIEISDGERFFVIKTENIIYYEVIN